MVGTCTPGEGAASDAGTPVSEVHPAEDHNTTSKPIERIEPKLVKLRRGISRAVYALNAAKQWQDAKDKERMEKRKRLIRMMNGDHEPDAELDHFMRLVLQEEADAQTPRPWYSVRHTSMIKVLPLRSRYDFNAQTVLLLFGFTCLDPLGHVHDDLGLSFWRLNPIQHCIQQGIQQRALKVSPQWIESRASTCGTKKAHASP